MKSIRKKLAIAALTVAASMSVGGTGWALSCLAGEIGTLRIVSVTTGGIAQEDLSAYEALDPSVFVQFDDDVHMEVTYDSGRESEVFQIVR